MDVELKLILDALKDVSNHAAWIAGIYLFLELVKLIALCVAPVWAIKILAAAWGKPTEIVKRFDIKDVCITSDGTGEALVEFLNDELVNTGAGTCYIHKSDLERLKRGWKMSAPTS